MKANCRSLLYGILLGFFISGLVIVLTRSIKNNAKISTRPQVDQSIPLVASLPDLCVSNQSTSPTMTKKVNLNYSTITELNSLPGIGEVKAKSIIDFRKKYGNFVTVDELLYVPGIGENLFQQICNLVNVNPKEDGE